MVSHYIKDCLGAIILFDLDNFKHSTECIQDCFELCAEHNVKKIVLAGNKQDLVQLPDLQDQIKELLASIKGDHETDLEFITISAKDDPNEAFDTLTKCLET